MYWVDELGVKQRVKYAALGSSSSLLYSMFDQENTALSIEDRSVASTLDLIRNLCKTLKHRSVGENEEVQGIMLIQGESSAHDFIM